MCAVNQNCPKVFADCGVWDWFCVGGGNYVVVVIGINFFVFVFGDVAECVGVLWSELGKDVVEFLFPYWELYVTCADAREAEY